MKAKILLILFASIFVALAQTNSSAEFRMVGSVKYDVSKPPFISVTIPVGAALVNEKSLHFNPASPAVGQSLELQTPAIYNGFNPIVIHIVDFPFSPTYFHDGYRQTGYTSRHKFGTVNQMETVPKIENCLVTKAQITLRLFPLSKPITNYTATGAMTITPARPVFRYGIPVQ